MMQRKNRPKPTNTETTNGYGSGYESSNDTNNSSTHASNALTNANIINGSLEDKTRSSPSKPLPAPLSSGGVAISALTGGGLGGSSSCGNHQCAGHQNSNDAPNSTSKKKGGKSRVVAMATVKRNFCGTQPFDKHWLNLDCCGLICAGMTYCLHMYGVYAFGWILLPPWFSVMDEDGYRELTFGCHFHRTLFITIAFLAVLAHFKAMTTDPGAVPPDANPLPDLDELDNLIKGEKSPTSSPTNNNNNNKGLQMMGGGGGLGGGQQPYNANVNSVSMNAMERGMNITSSSSLMQEDTSFGNGNNNNGSLLDNSSNNGRNNNGHGLPQAVATAGAVGAAVVGAAAGAAGAAAAGVAATGPIRPKNGNGGPPSQQPRGRRMCRRCQAFKPPRAHHCSICKRCIIKMDHHCPWVNNCVGIGNHKYFLLFIFYTSLSCAYSFLFIIYRFFHCIGRVSHNHSGTQYQGPRCVDHPTDLLPLVGLTVEALLFGLFTLCMMVDQWDVVMTNLTHIDRLKGEQHYNTPGHPVRTFVNNARAGINEVFGTGRQYIKSSSSSTSTALPMSRFHYTWLSPFHKVCFPDNIHDDIYGYCRPAGTSCVAVVERITSKSMEMVGRKDKKGRGGVGVADIV